MRVVNFSEARSGLKGVIDQVIADADYTVITRRDAPDAVLMSLDTFNSLAMDMALLPVSLRVMILILVSLSWLAMVSRMLHQD